MLRGVKPSSPAPPILPPGAGIACPLACFRAWFCACFCACMLAGCERITEHPMLPNETLEPVRGRATAVALGSVETATALARVRAERPRPSCRAPLPAGRARITTTLAFVGKRPDGSTRRWRIEHLWERDNDGDRRVRRVVHAALPDGRPTERRYEARVVGDRTFAAIDDRFAETTRDPAIVRDVDAAAFADVDALLALVQWRDRQLVDATLGDGLCHVARRPANAATLDAGAVSLGAVSLGAMTRSGWLRWGLEERSLGGRRTLTVHFDESVRSVADDIQAPELLWPIDPDASWREFEAFRDQGIDEGWWMTQPDTRDP